MTSIVAVLNKHAVAIAADSAVTMGNTHKVVNSANKIFTLSKYHPVAVMIYDSASFMGVPWDIIIKEYRKQLKNSSFLHLRDYMLDFIKFIKSRNFFCEENAQHFYLRSVLQYLFKYCMDEAKKQNPAGEENVLSSRFLKIVQDFSAKFENIEKCDDFLDYELKDFQKYAENDINILMNEFKIPSENRRFIEEVSLNWLRIKIINNINTGLVFVGYGEAEIYPSLVPINVSVGVDNRLRYYVDEKRSYKIGDSGLSSLIAPFAQVDVTQTIVCGINPAFQDIITKVVATAVSSIYGTIAKIVDKRPGNEDISLSIKELDLKEIDDLIIKEINSEMKASYMDPLMDTVISLDKEDMANMARSFISLTSLVRRMQPAEETVGGPVDVAVISKGDGFIWINRKHYFKPEFNTQFFNNYFK